MFIRPYRSADCPALAELFYETVHTVCARDFTPEQLAELYRVMGLSHKGQGTVSEKAELSLLPRKVSTGLMLA